MPCGHPTPKLAVKMLGLEGALKYQTKIWEARNPPSP